MPLGLTGDRKEPEEVWDGTQLYQWAARTPEFSHRGAVLLRPLPEDLTPGRWGGYKDTSRGPALDWHTALGTIRFVHSHNRKVATDVATALTQAGNPDGVRTVCALYGDVGITGPALVAAEVAHPRIEYEAEWGDVAALAGQALPWWPERLRLPELIRAWKPGSPAAVADVPPNTNEQILRRVAHRPPRARRRRRAVRHHLPRVHEGGAGPGAGPGHRGPAPRPAGLMGERRPPGDPEPAERQRRRHQAASLRLTVTPGGKQAPGWRPRPAQAFGRRQRGGRARGQGLRARTSSMREASATQVAAAGAMKPSTVWMSSRRASSGRCQMPSWWAMRLRNL